MSKYEIFSNEGIYAIYSSEESAFFAGYDFMGGVNWVKIPDVSCCMGREEAEQIVSDLESADATAEPEQPKQYLLKTDIEGEPIAKVMTATEIAAMYRDDQLCGIYGEMKVYDITNEPVRISLLDLVEPIISHWEWMDREYRDYCEAERYGEV